MDKNRSATHRAAQVQIIYFTDPLCCWSWALEPQWRRLLHEFNGQITYRYCMGGLLPGWKNYFDSVNSVSRPIQMGPVWMHAAQVSGMPVSHNIWMTDPPSTSYLACIAVKCASIQSAHAEDNYLRMLREAIMVNGQNIARPEVINEQARKLEKLVPSFSLEKFLDDMDNDTGLELFRKDLQEVQWHNINRFPSLVIKNEENKAVLVSGYSPYPALLQAFRKVAPSEKKMGTAPAER